jgi:hypothetical protein
MKTKYSVGDVLFNKIEQVGRTSKMRVVAISEERVPFGAPRVWYILQSIFDKLEIQQGLQNVVEDDELFCKCACAH